MSILRVENLTKTYPSAGRLLTVLHEVSFELAAGDTFAIVGPSGSGKTTLLGLCAGLDRATSGSVWVKDIRLDNLSEDERAAVRNQHVGFIFQNFQLLPTLTALENVQVPQELRGEKGSAASALALLERVGLGKRAHHYPAQLSGGEQQRVAVARAMLLDPPLLLADEPTGNLDSQAGGGVLDLLLGLQRQGKTVVIVTHDPNVAARTPRTIRMLDGHVESDGRPG